MKASLRVVSGWANQRDSNRSLGLGIIALVGGILVIPQAAAAFNDGNWISTGTDPGANGDVYAAVIDSSGNLYIGGNFTMVGGVAANRIAKWDGSSWSALGSGMGGGGPVDPPNVYALAVSGSNLYAGGNFTRAGDTNAS